MRDGMVRRSNRAHGARYTCCSAGTTKVRQRMALKSKLQALLNQGRAPLTEEKPREEPASRDAFFSSEAGKVGMAESDHAAAPTQAAKDHTPIKQPAKK